MMRLGIDFGTCYSSAALLLDNSLKPIKEPLKHGYSFPSSVFLTPEGEMLVGFAAENRRLKDIQRYKNEFKRVLGKPEPIFLGERQLQPEELITEVIARLKIEADKVVTGRGEPSLTQAILTVPATYKAHKRQLMVQACDRAGFSQVQLLDEPVAAAIYYSNTAKIDEGDIILVYDLGGGTFDVTLLQKQSSGYQILGMPDGDPDCGGIDFDRFIFQELLENCSEELRQKLLPKECRRERAFVLPICNDLKHDLSEYSKAEKPIPITMTMESFSLTRERFNELIHDLVSKTINCCDRLISDTKLEWSQIDRVLLVGGSCRIPYVREVIARKWGKTPFQIEDPELAVCLGAAIYGAELDLESPESYLQKGLIKIQTGDYQNAIAEFDRAICLDSNYAPAYCHRGLAHVKLKEDRAALEDYDLAIRLDRNCGEAYLHRGDLRCQSNDLKGAIEDYNYALFVNPDLTEAAKKKELVFERLISISQPQSNISVDETVKSERQKVNLESDNNRQTLQDNSASEIEAQKYLTKAQELLDRGDLQNSIVMFRESIRLNPNCRETHNDLGIALYKQEKFDEAKVELETAIRLDPYNAAAHHNLGVALYSQENFDGAKVELETAIRLDPYDAAAHYNLGNTLYKQEYLEQAIFEYKQALDLDPNFDVARSSLETAEAELKQRAFSKQTTPDSQVDKIVLDNSAIEEAQKYLTKAQELLCQRDYQKSILMLRESITLNPNCAEAHYYLANALWNQGRIEETISEYKEAIRLDPSNSSVHYYLGTALYSQGRLEEAISEYKEALNLNPNFDAARSSLEKAEAELKQRSSSKSEATEAQLKPETSTYNPELPSEWGADYTKLRDLLAAGNWKEADLETKAVFQKFGGLFDPLQSQGVVTTAIAVSTLVNPIALPVVMVGFVAYAKNKIKNIPQMDLSTIDRLWVEYSNGHFGFSVQEQIFTQVGKKEGDFAELMGWRGKAGTFGGAFAWKNHNQLTFSLNAPRGHLPSLPWWSKNGLGGLSDVFYSRVKSCQSIERNNEELESNNNAASLTNNSTTLPTTPNPKA